MEKQARVFEDREARREAVPLLVGLYGPSGTGKTFSALRLATGIQRITGGDIYVGDSEARRALHYADRFRFRHVPFAPPFGSLDYLAMIRHCVSKGAKIIVVDSYTHEHEGEGGHLQAHDAEIDRLVAAAAERGGNTRRDSHNMQAWIPLKRARTEMIQGILQMGVTLIACFRAKEKVKPTKTGKIVEMGWQPIGAEEMFYEMTVTCLLRPGCGGVPSWDAEQDGERPMIKLPAQFRELLVDRKAPLDEGVGEALARWAAGDEAAQKAAAEERAAVDGVIAKIAAFGEARDGDGLNGYLRSVIAPKYPSNGPHGARIGAALDAAWSKIEAKPAAPAPSPSSPPLRAKKSSGADPQRAALAEKVGLSVEVVGQIEQYKGADVATAWKSLRAKGVDVTADQVHGVLTALAGGQ